MVSELCPRFPVVKLGSVMVPVLKMSLQELKKRMSPMVPVVLAVLELEQVLLVREDQVVVQVLRMLEICNQALEYDQV